MFMFVWESTPKLLKSLSLDQQMAAGVCLCLNTVLCSVTGEHRANALVHSHPDSVPCSTLDREVQSSIPRTSIRYHPHHSAAHVYDPASLH